MGIVINADLETNAGPTNELYVRIENWKVNLSVAQIRFTTTAWLNKTYGEKFLRRYYDDPLRNSIGIVGTKVIYYPEDGEHKELDLVNLYEMPMYTEQVIEEPVYEIQEVSKELPYVSFDENGDEITLYRTVKQQEEVQVGKNEVTKKVIDYTLVNRLEEVSYEYLKEQLINFFPEESINIE